MKGVVPWELMCPNTTEPGERSPEEECGECCSEWSQRHRKPRMSLRARVSQASVLLFPNI